MGSDLATALAAERAIVRRAVAAARTIDCGWVVRHPPLTDAWHLNRIHLTGGVASGLDAPGLQALSERELSGVRHRRVTVDDVRAADRVWPALERDGWRRERSVVMVRDGRAPAPEAVAGAVAAVVGVDGPELFEFQRLAFADDAWVDPGEGAPEGSRSELPALAAQTQALLRAGTRWRAFGAGRGDGALPACTATLYLDPGVGGRRVAFVDQLATLRAFRERGLARAVMLEALGSASTWEADLVALFADADDWPQVFYASLGFETVGRQTVFHRNR